MEMTLSSIKDNDVKFFFNEQIIVFFILNEFIEIDFRIG